MGTQDVWDALVTSMRSWADVAERQPHGLIVSARRDDGSLLEVEIVMTPDEFWAMAGIVIGSVELAVEQLRGQVLAQPPDQRYLVYTTYELEPCATPEIPPTEEELRMEELMRQHPDGIPGGGWYAYRPGERERDR